MCDMTHSCVCVFVCVCVSTLLRQSELLHSLWPDVLLAMHVSTYLPVKIQIAILV